MGVVNVAEGKTESGEKIRVETEIMKTEFFPPSTWERKAYMQVEEITAYDFLILCLFFFSIYRIVLHQRPPVTAVYQFSSSLVDS